MPPTPVLHAQLPHGSCSSAPHTSAKCPRSAIHALTLHLPRRVARYASQGLINAIDWLDEHNTLYKSAQFWRDAATTYLKRDVLGAGRPSVVKLCSVAAAVVAFAAVGSSFLVEAS